MFDSNYGSIVEHFPKKPKWLVQTLKDSPLELDIPNHKITSMKNISLLEKIQLEYEA